MPDATSSLTLAAAGAGVGLCIFGVLAFGSSGHAETLSTKPNSVLAALQGRALSLPVTAAREAQDRSGRRVRVVYPGPYAQR